jgi:hypothetical protein
MDHLGDDGPHIVEITEAPPPTPKLCERIEPGLREIASQDPLGLQTITTDRILPALLPGVLALSRRARYLSIYSFLLRRYEQSAGQADNTALDVFVRSRELRSRPFVIIGHRNTRDSTDQSQTIVISRPWPCVLPPWSRLQPKRRAGYSPRESRAETVLNLPPITKCQE